MFRQIQIFMNTTKEIEFQHKFILFYSIYYTLYLIITVFWIFHVSLHIMCISVFLDLP